VIQKNRIKLIKIQLNRKLLNLCFQNKSFCLHLNYIFSDETKSNNHNNNTNNSTSKHAKKVAAIEESVQGAFLRNMTISDEFMKWCQEQLKDFHVERKKKN